MGDYPIADRDDGIDTRRSDEPLGQKARGRHHMIDIDDTACRDRQRMRCGAGMLAVPVITRIETGRLQSLRSVADHRRTHSHPGRAWPSRRRRGSVNGRRDHPEFLAAGAPDAVPDPHLTGSSPRWCRNSAPLSSASGGEILYARAPTKPCSRGTRSGEHPMSITRSDRDHRDIRRGSANRDDSEAQRCRITL